MSRVQRSTCRVPRAPVRSLFAHARPSSSMDGAFSTRVVTLPASRANFCQEESARELVNLRPPPPSWRHGIHAREHYDLRRLVPERAGPSSGPTPWRHTGGNRSTLRRAARLSIAFTRRRSRPLTRVQDQGFAAMGTTGSRWPDKAPRRPAPEANRAAHSSRSAPAIAFAVRRTKHSHAAFNVPCVKPVAGQREASPNGLVRLMLPDVGAGRDLYADRAGKHA